VYGDGMQDGAQGGKDILPHCLMMNELSWLKNMVLKNIREHDDIKPEVCCQFFIIKITAQDWLLTAVEAHIVESKF